MISLRSFNFEESDQWLIRRFASALPQAGGLPAISRWLSGATPPETARTVIPSIPEGCQHKARGRMEIQCDIVPKGLRSLRDRIARVRVCRGCRRAQPPANGWHPSGMAG